MEISRLLRHRRVFNTSTLAQKFEVSTKSIWRDLEFMRNRLGYVIEYSPKEWSFVGKPPKERVL